MSAPAVTVLPEPDAASVREGRSRDAWGVPPAERAVEESGARAVALGPDTQMIVVAGRVDQDELRRAIDENSGVRVVQLPSAGVDAYVETMKSCARDGLVFTSAKGAYSAPVAEHALALLLATLRSLQIRARATSWEREQRGVSLNGSRVIIVGAGGIGTELLRLLGPFDVHVTMVRRTRAEVEGADRTITTDELLDALPEADAVVIAAALTGDTRSLLGAPEFAAMKGTAVVVNIARGPLVDTDALVDALTNGRIGAAGLDVTDPEPLPDDHPLWTLPGALITPHQANTNAMTEPLFQERVRENIQALADGTDPIGVVDVEQGY